MTARPMTEAVEAARRIVAWDDAGRLADDEWLVERNESAIIAIARALLSTSAAERGLREALEAIKRMPGPAMAGPTGLVKFLAYDRVVEIIDAALSPKGEDEQARGQGRSAPISTDTKGTSR